MEEKPNSKEKTLEFDKIAIYPVIRATYLLVIVFSIWIATNWGIYWAIFSGVLLSIVYVFLALKLEKYLKYRQKLIKYQEKREMEIQANVQLNECLKDKPVHKWRKG